MSSGLTHILGFLLCHFLSLLGHPEASSLCHMLLMPWYPPMIQQTLGTMNLDKSLLLSFVGCSSQQPIVWVPWRHTILMVQLFISVTKSQWTMMTYHAYGPATNLMISIILFSSTEVPLSTWNTPKYLATWTLSSPRVSQVGPVLLFLPALHPDLPLS